MSIKQREQEGVTYIGPVRLDSSISLIGVPELETELRTLVERKVDMKELTVLSQQKDMLEDQLQRLE